VTAQALANPDKSKRWRRAADLLLSRGVMRGAAIVCTVVCVVALFAEFIASDLPFVLKFHGHLYLMPNLFNPPELRIFDARLLIEHMNPGDWAILPMVPWGYNTHDLNNVLAPPSALHWLGTDAAGRDVLSRLVYGARVSLTVGLLSVVLLVAIGMTLGTIAAYFGGWVDTLLMRIVEVVHSIPTILLLVTILAVVAPQGFSAVLAIAVVIGAVRWTDVARLIRGEVLRVKTLDYVLAARAAGANSRRIIFQHVLPNASSPVLVSATFALAAAILIEGALSFLGFGIPDDMASWGGLLNGVRDDVQAWWLAVFPGGAMFLTVTAFNVLGEGVRDAVDPRLRT